MENSFQTSFIPKKPIMMNNNSVSGSGNSTSIPVVVSVALIVIMVIIGGGLYLYKGYLEKNKADLSASLFKIRDSFDKDTINELELYDKRTTVAKQILNNHIVISPLFELLNKLTLSSIQYTSFSHSVSNNVYSVKMSGIARDYKSIALQADVFNTSQGSMFKNIIFSNLTTDKNNNVTFDIEFDVDPALLSYSNNIVNINSENTNTANTSTPNTTDANPVVSNTNASPTPSTNNTNQPVLPTTNTTP